MSWLNNVIGGIDTPKIYKLEDNDRVTNGSLEDTLSTEWQGAGYTRVTAASESIVAPRGDYILKVDDDDAGSWERAFQSVDYGSALGNKSFLLILKARASGSDHSVDIKLGSSTTSGGAINNTVKLTVPLKTDYWRFIHVIVTFSSETDQYVRLELGGTITTISETGIAFYDDIRLYEIQDTYTLEQPKTVSGSSWEQRWDESITTEFELIDGKNRKVIEGWRYVLNMIYQYHSASEQQTLIEITENGLNFVVPHNDNLFGSLMQWNGNYENEYFFGRYLGHSAVVSLKAVELEKDKPREIGTDYTLS